MYPIVRRRRARGWFPRCCIYEAFRMEDLWSGKIDPDNEIVQSQLSNFGPEGYDDNDVEAAATTNDAKPEESPSEDTTSASASASSSSSSTSSSNKVRQRKARKET